MTKEQSRYVVNWLYTCLAFVFGMVLLGGLTRLTDSGLSITEWEPLKGALPPIGDEWQVYFDKYKQIPEYKEINAGMSLAEFKEIFWLEYIHRLFGRIAGFVFFIPFVYFAVKKYFSREVTIKLAFIFLLGGLQGFVGWYMVSSGLSERTDVSQFRLAFHLINAFIIFALLLWMAMDLQYARARFKIFTITNFISLLIFFMIFLGALVAGTDAGFLGDASFKMPSEIYAMEPWWLNHFENRATILYQHKIFAIILSLLIFVYACYVISRGKKYYIISGLLLLTLIIQIALGMSTILLFRGLEEYFAANGYHKIWQPSVIIAQLHQLGALLLLSFNLIITHKLLRN